MSTDAAIRPTFHHFNFKTTRLQELIDWYTTVVGAAVTFQDATGASLTGEPFADIRRRVMAGELSPPVEIPTQG